MLAFIRKDVLLFWRNRKELAIAVLLPVLLVLVLNFAFQGLFGGGGESLRLDVAIVNEDRDPAGKERLLDEWRHPAFAGWLNVRELDRAEAERQVEAGRLDGAVILPDGYSRLLTHPLPAGGAAPLALPLVVKEDAVKAGIIRELLDEYHDAVLFHQALTHAAGREPAKLPLPAGGREWIAAAEPFTMKQYATIATAALFSLFLAVTVAERTVAEKRDMAFHRIRVTNARPLHFLLGKSLAAFLLSWLQFLFIVLAVHLLLGVFAGKSAAFWGGLVAAATAYALLIAGLAALYTSISLRVQNPNATSGLLLMATILLGSLGGGFVPAFLFPEWLRRIGEWTPNGLLLAKLTAFIQYGGPAPLLALSSGLAAIAAACLLAGAALFPGREEG